MFADSLLDAHWDNHSRRGWTALLSFGLQAVALGALVLLPFTYSQVLPQVERVARIVLPEPPAALPPNTAATPVRIQSNMVGDRLMTPQRIPTTITNIVESVPPAPAQEVAGLQVIGGMQDGRGTGFHGILGMAAALPPKPAPPAPARTYRSSSVMEGSLIHRVQPQYPPIAVQTRTQGKVVLHAVISKDGTIENLEVVSGHPLLIRAAIDAVRRWRYRPYYLNGEPVEVETQVTVNFVLSCG